MAPTSRPKSHSSGSEMFELGTGLAADIAPMEERQAVEPMALRERAQRQCPLHQASCTFEDEPN